jgi:dihydroceramidase
MEVNLRPSLRAKYGMIARKEIPESTSRTERAKMARRDKKTLRDMWWMIAFGLSIFLGGFGLWTLDNEYCSTFRRWRKEVGMPWGFLLEFHGWW